MADAEVRAYLEQIDSNQLPVARFHFSDTPRCLFEYMGCPSLPCGVTEASGRVHPVIYPRDNWVRQVVYPCGIGYWWAFYLGLGNEGNTYRTAESF